MLRLMLDHHPLIDFRTGEFELATIRVPDVGWPDLASFYRYLETECLSSGLAGLAVDRTLSYPELIRSFFDQAHADSNAQVAGSVVHSNFPRCLDIWPKAKFIHLVRDPRDVAVSWVNMGWVGNAYSGAQGWLKAEERWDRLAAQLPSERKIELSFERLASDPQPELERLCAFMGLAYDEQMLDYPRTSTYGYPDRRHVQSWRTKLSKRDVQLVEHLCGARLTERGYELSGYPTHTPHLLERLELGLESRWRRARGSIRRYGLPLWLAFQATRCGPRAAVINVRRRMSVIESRLLK